MSEWREKKLGDVALFIDYRGKTPRKTSAGIPLITAKIVKNGTILPPNEFIASEDYDAWMTRGLPQIGDVVLTTEAPLGEVAQLKDAHVALAQRIITLRANADVLDNTFLKYFLQSAEGQRRLKMRESGTTVTGIKSSELQEVLIPLPELETQKRIARILSSLDDKIEVNNQINRNLEEQANTLFEHFFVKYIPYGGSIPENWKSYSLEDICLKITDGSHYSPKDNPKAKYPMLSVKDMGRYDFIRSGCKHIDQAELDRMKQNDCVPLKDDILVAKDGSYLKEIFICDSEKQEAILSSIAIFRPNTSIILPEILLCLLKHPSVRKEVADNYVSGSALPRIVLKDFKRFTSIIPPLSEQKKIGETLSSIRFSISKNVETNVRLANIRNTLLPKLMSGEINVSEVGK